MRALVAVLSVMAVVLVGGCAYHFGPVNGMTAGARSVEIRPFVNRTLEPRISEYVSLAIRREVQKDGTFALETQGPGDIIVTGEIVGFERSELSYRATDTVTPQDYNLKLTAKIVAIDRSTGKTNLDRLVTGRTSIRVGNDLSNVERQAIPMLADDLAVNAVSALANPAW